MKKEDRYIVVNYNHEDDHCLESLIAGTIGIPNRKNTNGRNLLNKASAEYPLYGVLYDVVSHSVRGFFTTLDEAYYTDEPDTFSGAIPENNWGHRIKVMSHISNNRRISLNTFRQMGGKVVKGSMCRIPETTWIKVKEFFTADN